MTDEVTNKSLFNAGVAKLMRIDNIKKQLVMANITDNEKLKSRLLESFRTEMDERISKNKEEANMCNGYEKQIHRLLTMNHNTVRAWDTNILDKYLTAYERYLNQLEYKYGYSMPDAEDAGYALR